LFAVLGIDAGASREQFAQALKEKTATAEGANLLQEEVKKRLAGCDKDLVNNVCRVIAWSGLANSKKSS